MKPYLGSENNFQKAVARYLDSRNLFWCHIPNGMRTSIKQASVHKAMGMRSGMPDVMIFERKHTYTGLAIELKVGKNKPTANQKACMEQLKKRGWFACVSYSLDEVIEIVDDYLRLSL